MSGAAAQVQMSLQQRLGFSVHPAGASDTTSGVEQPEWGQPGVNVPQQTYAAQHRSALRHSAPHGHAAHWQAQGGRHRGVQYQDWGNQPAQHVMLPGSQHQPSYNMLMDALLPSMQHEPLLPGQRITGPAVDMRTCVLQRHVCDMFLEAQSAVNVCAAAPVASQLLLFSIQKRGVQTLPLSGCLEAACRLKLVLAQSDSSTASVTAALHNTAPGFSPGLPGLTKLVSKFAKEGEWQKALEIFRNVGTVGLQADTTITNAAIAACGTGRDAEQAQAIFDNMPVEGLAPDAITHKALVASLLRCGKWQRCVHVCSRL